MSFEKNELLNDEQARVIIENMITTGRAGFFSWAIERDVLDVMDNQTNRKFDHLTNLPDFIQAFVFEKDREMALQDLDYFMKGKVTNYQSTFRIIDLDGGIRWIFVKGTMRSDKIMNGVMYNVSANNLMQGHDLKTNLMNGDTFIRKLKNAVHQSERKDESGALLYIEIDNYHTIMNKYGLEFGSAISYQTSRILLDFVTDCDEIGRFASNKFMILLSEIENLKEVTQFSQKISTKFKEPLNVKEQPIYLNINMGITIFPEISADANELIRFSDFAISHARDSGDNVGVYFDSELKASYNREMDIENELPGALIDGEFYLVYQPQINLKTNKISGFETLIRWKNKNLGLVSPAEFIPVAEKKGYIVAIGRWIRMESIKTVRRWLDQGIEFEKMSINVSSIEFEQKRFRENLLFVCNHYEVDPRMIELELTEGTLMNTNDGNKKILDDLMDAGFKIALDDFGTGYSNFSTLLNFDINTLKLDKTLIDNINDEIRRYFLKSLISSKNFLHYNVIAEGVEDKETLDILTELDCDTVQGYHFSKPLPKHEMEQFIADYQE